MENSLKDKEILKTSLEKLISQISAYNDVMRLQYPNAIPMMQILREMSEECLELATLNESTPVGAQNPLSKRELEVITQVSRGLLNKEIAFTLGISIRTVEFHLKSIFTKTGTQSRTEAAVQAVKNQWVTT